jgi:holo-[acyl-carrier protein] synthase
MFTVGHEVVDLKGFGRRLEHDGRRFMAGTFTAEEYNRSPRYEEERLEHLAGLFAAKRAFVKAWSSTMRGAPPPLIEVELREIEIVDDGFGRPGLRLHGMVAEAVEDLVLGNGLRVEAQVSISCDGPVASAVVVLSS